MLMVFKGIKQEYVYIADTEYDNMKLIESAGFVFKRVDERNDIYQLSFSFDVYIKRRNLNKYTVKYTGITDELLEEKGMSLKEFKEFYADIFKEIDPADTLFVSHGTNTDKIVIKKSGVKFHPEHSFCTYKNAKRLLNRENELSLGDVAAEAGYHLADAHDAYKDALATVIAFSFLKKIEWQEN